MGLYLIILHINPRGLYLFILLINPPFTQQNQLSILLLPKLYQSLKLNPSYILKILFSISQWNSFLRMHKLINDIKKSIKTINLLKKSLRIWIILIKKMIR